MKFNIKRTTLAALLLTGLVTACNKPDKITLESEGTIYMATAVDQTAKFTLYLADTAQTVAFGAAYSGMGFPKNDIPVTFTLQKGLVESFNQENGTDYVLLPEEAYSVEKLTSVIPAGKTTSVPLDIAITTSLLDRSKKYMLPIQLENVAGGKMSTTLNITYFRLEDIVRRETNVTGLARLTVFRDHRDGPGHGEGSPKLVDDDNATKFLIHQFPADFWAQLEFTEPQLINMYRLTSGNDAPERDPSNWRFMGSNDGTNWTLLDTQTGQSFAGRGQTKSWEFENEQEFKYYRLYIDKLFANNIGALFQLAEWRLVTFF